MKKIAKFADRLNEALSLRDVKPAELHRRTGISEATISQYRSGYAEPKKEKLQAIAEALAVDPAFLMGLDVSPTVNYPSAKLAKDQRQAELRAELEQAFKHQDIAQAYSEADKKTQKMVRMLLGLDE